MVFPLLGRKAGILGRFLQFLVFFDSLVDLGQLSCRLEQIRRLFFKLFDDIPKRGNPCTSGKQRLPHLAFLGENFFTAPHQGVVVNAIEGFKDFRLHTVQKGSKNTQIQRITIHIDDIGLTFFPTLKGYRAAITTLKETTDKKLIIGMHEVIRSALGKTIQQGLERSERAAFACFIGSKDDMQTRLLGVKLQGSVCERTKGLQIKTLDSH